MSLQEEERDTKGRQPCDTETQGERHPKMEAKIRVTQRQVTNPRTTRHLWEPGPKQGAGSPSRASGNTPLRLLGLEGLIHIYMYISNTSVFLILVHHAGRRMGLHFLSTHQSILTGGSAGIRCSRREKVAGLQVSNEV